MVTCGICTQDLSGAQQGITQSPTCACLYHTTCLISHAHTAAFWQNLECPGCQAILSVNDSHSDHGVSVHPEFHPEQLQANPAFRADLKALKLRQRERGGAAKAYSNARKEAIDAWKQQIAEPLAQIKTAQKEAIMGLRATDSYKTFLSKTRGFDTARARFQAKYKLCRHNLYTFIKRESFTTRWSHRRLMNFSRAFRLYI